MGTTAAVAAGLSLLATDGRAGEVLTPARVFASPDLSGPTARGVQMAPDGSAVTWLKSKPSDVTVTDLWIADVAGGSSRLLIDGGALSPKDHTLSEAEKSRREREGVQTHGVVDYAWDDEGRFIVVPVEGHLWLFVRESGAVRQLTNTPASDIDAKVSPKGGYVSFIRDDNLYIVPTAGGPERALTQGGTELTSWGTAEFIAQEEFDRPTGYWWSPDETRIALTRVDQSDVDVIERPEIGATGATVVRQRYPRAGRRNAQVELYIEDLATLTRTRVDLDSSSDIYIPRVDWSKDGRILYVQRLSRDQRHLEVLAVDPTNGTARVILAESSPHWVEVTSDFTPLHDGRFLWTSERSGYRHLYLYSGSGQLIRQLTHGEWPVGMIEGVDEARGVAVIGASKDNPTERRLYAVPWLRQGPPVAITAAGGWWTAVVAKRGGSFVGTYQDPATPPQTALYRGDGTRVRWIEENRLAEGHPYFPYLPRHRLPEFGTLAAADGQQLWWSLRTPPGFDPGRRYPVVVQVYGGPAHAMVVRQWPNPVDQLFLEAGFILFSLDNRGTPNRSVAFKTALDRRFGTVEVEDCARPALRYRRGGRPAQGRRVSEITALRRCAAHRCHWMVKRWLHDPDAAHSARFAVCCGCRGRTGERLQPLRYGIHRALHGNSRGQPGGVPERGRAAAAAAPEARAPAHPPRHGRRQRHVRSVDTRLRCTADWRHSIRNDGVPRPSPPRRVDAQ